MALRSDSLYWARHVADSVEVDDCLSLNNPWQCWKTIVIDINNQLELMIDVTMKYIFTYP